MQDGLAGGPGDRDGQSVDRLAALAVRQLPVRDGRDVGDRVADAGAHEARRRRRGRSRGRRPRRSGWARRTSPGRAVVERRDRRADAVVGEVGGDRDHRQAARVAAYLATSMILPPPMPTTASYRLLPSASGERRAAEARLPSQTSNTSAPGSDGREPVPDLLARARCRPRPARAGAEIRSWSSSARSSMAPAADVDDERAGQHPGQYWHAISLALARSSWLSTSTQRRPRWRGATSIRSPRSTSSW